jgi:hypothetical protein
MKHRCGKGFIGRFIYNRKLGTHYCELCGYEQKINRSSMGYVVTRKIIKKVKSCKWCRSKFIADFSGRKYCGTLCKASFDTVRKLKRRRKR